MTAEVRFACTKCGNCCRDLTLPLTVSEAIGWLENGNDVQVICEAEPWPQEPAAGDARAQHRRRRSFPTMCGTLATRVTVLLAANLAGRCPNLLADMRCGIYAHRPLVCRIYPAEINPFVQLSPAHKACPPEAWTDDLPLLQRDGVVIDDATRRDIQRSRDRDAADTAAKEYVCAALGLNRAGLATEGVIVFSPAPTELLAALHRSRCVANHDVAPGAWQIVSNSSQTVQVILNRGALAAMAGEHHRVPCQYSRIQSGA
ncbi:MAG: YkgJ family cysteine cluster protein [Steroidobacteraceae bacterium]